GGDDVALVIGAVLDPHLLEQIADQVRVRLDDRRRALRRLLRAEVRDGSRIDGHALSSAADSEVGSSILSPPGRQAVLQAARAAAAPPALWRGRRTPGARSGVCR